jgi:sulfate adenylyltransferase subunit 2
MSTHTSLSHLESESIEIFREAAACAERPVLLYSMGKDSTVLLHLARKAFHPGPVRVPLLHVDTSWKFREMYEYRDRVAAEPGIRMIVHRNQAGIAAGVTPFTHGTGVYTDVMKTEALKQALDLHRFDIVFAGARRDEEPSRAKERICSFRGQGHRWDPRAQRPEFWAVYNLRVHPGESIRVFPLSNWTELDVWRYIEQERLQVVPLYFSAERPVVERDGTLLMVDDDRLPLAAGEQPRLRRVRFRTLGCYPLSGAVESAAATVADIIRETERASLSERSGRLIDFDQPSSMERKKREGYF